MRQADAEGAVSLTDLEGVPALALGRDGEYVTYIYCHDGWLRELMTQFDGKSPRELAKSVMEESEKRELYLWCEEPPAPQDGRELIPARGLGLSLEDGLLTVRIDGEDGGSDTLLLSLRSGGGGPS